MTSHAAARELRNNTAVLLRRVAAGDRIVITTRGRPVAELVPLATERRRWLPREELVRRLGRDAADAGLRADLARFAGETTDDLGRIG